MTEEQLQKRREYARQWRKDNPNYQRTWHKGNPDYQEKWRQDNPDYLVNHHRKRNYGVTPEMFQDMLQEQSCLCAICGRLFSDNPADKPCIDHCHTTKRVRGILCGLCNKGLGQFKDNPAFLAAAIDYLTKHS